MAFYQSTRSDPRQAVGSMPPLKALPRFSSAEWLAAVNEILKGTGAMARVNLSHRNRLPKLMSNGFRWPRRSKKIQRNASAGPQSAQQEMPMNSLTTRNRGLRNNGQAHRMLGRLDFAKSKIKTAFAFTMNENCKPAKACIGVGLLSACLIALSSPQAMAARVTTYERREREA